MIPFIQSIDNIVPKLLRHIETSAIMDLLLKVISMDKSEPNAGIVDVIFIYSLHLSLVATWWRSYPVPYDADESHSGAWGNLDTSPV